MKGNMLLGHARGAVGDVVFTRYGGQQIGYSRNRKPKNPRTEKQCLQRSLFVNQVKFFTRGTQNLFKFAYENKRNNESDFNAFMRNNKTEGVLMSRLAFDEPSYPAIGNWMMSYGSLPTPEITTGEGIFGEEICFVVGSSETGNMETVGDLSSAILAHYKVEKGDIVTFVQLVAFNSTEDNTPSIVPQPRGIIEWRINQIRLDPASTQTIGQAMPDIVANYTNTEIFFETYGTECIAAATVIFSRETQKGLLASTSRLVNNVQAMNVIHACQSETYRKAIVEAWQADQKALLAGTAIIEKPVAPLESIQSARGVFLEFHQQAVGDPIPKYGTLSAGYLPGEMNSIDVFISNPDVINTSKFAIVNAGTEIAEIQMEFDHFQIDFEPAAGTTGEIYLYYSGTKLWTINRHE